MNEEQINPGYNNQIFIFGNPVTTGNRAVFQKGETTQSLEFEFSPNTHKDLITVRATSYYVERTNLGDQKIPIITDKTTFRVIINHPITIEELFPIVAVCTERLNQHFLQEETIQLSKGRLFPPRPTISDLHTQLEELALYLNESI